MPDPTTHDPRAAERAARLDQLWQQNEQRHQAARRAAWRAVLARLRSPAAWAEQIIELGIFATQLTVVILMVAMLLACAAYGMVAVPGESWPVQAWQESDRQLLLWVAGVLVAFAGGIASMFVRPARWIGSPFVRAWQAAYRAKLAAPNPHAHGRPIDAQP